jgi:hypothetical protein
VNCTSNCPLYLICESHASTHCVGFNTTDLINDAVVVLSSAAGAWLPALIKLIFNRRNGQSTDEIEGTDQGGNDPDPPPAAVNGKCLASDVAPNGSNDRVYNSYRSACFGNDRTSWYFSADKGKGNYDYINRHSLAEGRDDGLAYLSTREGADLYVKPDSQPGTWSTWSWYQYATCTSGC